MNVIQAVVSSMVVKGHVIILTEVINAVVQLDITLHQMEETVQVNYILFPVIKLTLIFQKQKYFVSFSFHYANNAILPNFNFTSQ